ncbi:MAG: patatin-like phospholipase family protein [Oceanicaulis sp.]
MGLLSSLGRMFNRAPAASGPAPAPAPYARKDLAAHFSPEGRKRILALDGGGVRGAMSIAVLERIETILRNRHGGHPDFRLCDYFDLVGGTSTGSIIAAGLAAKRMTAAEIAQMYDELAGDVFKGRLFALGATRAKFDAKNLRRQLKGVFGEMTLGDPGFATGYAAVAKRIDTVSPWVLHNNPQGRYFDDPPDRAFHGNKHYPITRVVRASAAAPLYFDPERIEIAPGEFGEFIDGGLTPHNNPAFQMLMLAGLKGHNFGWTLNADQLFMISIGTGSMIEKSVERPGLMGRLSGARALKALMSTISSSEDFIELLMQWASQSLDPNAIDSEIGDLSGDLLGGDPLLTYERYQCRLDRTYLRSELGLNLSERQMSLLREMTNAKAVPIARDVGLAMAERYVREEHFPARFDLVGGSAPAPRPAGAGAPQSV